MPFAKGIGEDVRDATSKTSQVHHFSADLCWHLKKDLNELPLAEWKIRCEVNTAGRYVHGFNRPRSRRRCLSGLKLQWNIHNEPARGSTTDILCSLRTCEEQVGAKIRRAKASSPNDAMKVKPIFVRRRVAMRDSAPRSTGR
jgi:hypothetical protein